MSCCDDEYFDFEVEMGVTSSIRGFLIRNKAGAAIDLSAAGTITIAWHTIPQRDGGFDEPRTGSTDQMTKDGGVTGRVTYAFDAVAMGLKPGFYEVRFIAETPPVGTNGRFPEETPLIMRVRDKA